MANVLAEFTLCALGRVHRFEAPICGTADLAWAEDALKRLPGILAAPKAAAAESVPTPERLAALAHLAKERIREGAEAFARRRVAPSKNRQGMVKVRGGVGPARMLWLEDGRLSAALKRQKKAWQAPLPGTSADPLSVAGVFGVGFVRRGAAPLDGFWLDVELSMLVKESLGFDQAGLSDAASALVAALGEGAAMPRGAEAMLGAVSEVLGEMGGDHVLAAMANVACARRAASLLYPGGAKGEAASRLWLSGPRLGPGSNLDALGKGEFGETGLAAAEQTPETLALCSALAPALGVGELGLDAAGRVKKELASRFELSPAGWKGLVALCAKRPSLAFEIGLACGEDQGWEAESYSMFGYAKALADGSYPDAGQAKLRDICELANMCAAGGVDFEQAFDAVLAPLAPPGMRAPRVALVPFISLMGHAPIAWRETVVHHESKGKPEPWLARTWADICERRGVSGETELSPRGVERLRGAGWIPEGDDELRVAALDRDRRAREGKGPMVVRGLLSRLRALGPGSKKLEREANEVVDFLGGVELGFWEQAPEDIGWPWIKERAARWHERMDEAKASEMSWEAVEPRGAEDGWVELGGGWRGRELVHGGELHSEGRLMSHCVSSYAERCGRGECRVFSLRSDAGGKSTLELRPARDASGLEVGATTAQHRGFANSEPPLMAKLAAQRLERRVAEKLAGAPRAKPAAPRAG